MSTNSSNGNDVTITVGTKVLIQGLDKAPQYNYHIGTVIDQQQATGRLSIRLRSNPKKVLGIKPEKLTAVPNLETVEDHVYGKFCNLAHDVGRVQGKYKQEVEILEALEEVNTIPQASVFITLWYLYAQKLNNFDKAFTYVAQAALALNLPIIPSVNSYELLPGETALTTQEGLIKELATSGFGFLMDCFLGGERDVGKLEKTCQVMENIIILAERVSRDEISFEILAQMYFCYSDVLQKMSKFMEAAEMYKKADEYRQMHAPGERYVSALLPLPEMFMCEAVLNEHPQSKMKELFEEGIAEARNSLKITTELNDERVYKAKTLLAYLLFKSIELHLAAPTIDYCQETLSPAQEGYQVAMAKGDQPAIDQAHFILDNLKLA